MISAILIYHLLELLHTQWIGTTIDSETRGSSLIGDGLASTVYNFPNIEEERTRIIILSTDNDLEGKEIVTLEEAAKLAKKKNIIIYAIAPDNITSANREGLKRAAEITGGSYFEGTSSSTIDKIVKKIEKTDKNSARTRYKIFRKDNPQIPFVLLVVSIFILFILNREVEI